MAEEFAANIYCLTTVRRGSIREQKGSRLCQDTLDVHSLSFPTNAVNTLGITAIITTYTRFTSDIIVLNKSSCDPDTFAFDLCTPAKVIIYRASTGLLSRLTLQKEALAFACLISIPTPIPTTIPLLVLIPNPTQETETHRTLVMQSSFVIHFILAFILGLARALPRRYSLVDFLSCFLHTRW